jgi:hypothetical protein
MTEEAKRVTLGEHVAETHRTKPIIGQVITGDIVGGDVVAKEESQDVSETNEGDDDSSEGSA